MGDQRNKSPPDLKQKQWKYVGYRGFCHFAASDNDFLLLRRFGNIATRSLLALQDELVELESQLETLENQLMCSTGPEVHHGSFREETQEARVELIKEMTLKLRAYYDLVQQYSQVRSRPKAPQKSIQSISNWFANHENAILEEETDYIQKTHDLFQVVPRQTSQLRAFLEQSSRFRLMSIWEKRSLDEDTIHYIADRRIDAFINGLTTIIGFVMLTAPLWTLAWVKPMASRLGIITAFIFLFLVLVNTLSVARPFEVLAATAAYAAVLVVFLQLAR